MMKRTSINIWIWLIVWIAMSVSCQLRPVTERLNQVESIIWSMPDSAYVMLCELSFPSHMVESEKARYALLMTHASNRTNRPVLSDSLINVAMDYYSSQPETNEYALSCLFRGNIMENQGNVEEALKMYLSAKNAMDKLTDRRIHFMVYVSLGNLYVQYGFYREAVMYYELALSLNLQKQPLNKVDFSKPFKGIVYVYPIDDSQVEIWETLVEKTIKKVQQYEYLLPCKVIFQSSEKECTEEIQKQIQYIRTEYAFSALKNENYDLKQRWIITFLITSSIIMALALIIYEGRKFYRKKQMNLLKQYRKEAAELQQQIDELQELEDENLSLAHRMDSLEKEKLKKELRIRQLEVMFRAKEITLSVEMMEAVQVYLRIIDTQNPGYSPTEDRYKLARWLDTTCKQFATRLSESYPALTNGDKDICYLFALNLSFQEVAEVLNIQIRSVERSVCRICQRMGLPQNGKDEFLNVIKGML